MFILIGICPMADIWLPVLWHNGGEGFVHPTVGFTEVLQCKEEWQPLLPNGRFAEGSYDWSVMSSITGPSLGSELPRTILPMEVVTVYRYTNPMVSSFTTQLELMLKRLGLDTIPMDIVPTGIFQSTSTSSRVLKQVTTLAKPWGGVGGLTNASVLAGRGDFGGDGALGGWMVGWWKWSRWVEGLFSLLAAQQLAGGFPCGYHRLGWVYYCVPPSVLWSHLWYGWHLWGGGGTRGISGSGSRSWGFAPSSLGRSTPWKTSSSMKER